MSHILHLIEVAVAVPAAVTLGTGLWLGKKWGRSAERKERPGPRTGSSRLPGS